MNEKLELVILKYNKKNVCVLPIMPKLKPLLMEYYKNDPRKRVKGGSLYLIVGNNYVPKKYWDAVKEHVMVNMLIKDGIIEEIQNEDPKIVEQKKKLEVKKADIINEKEETEKEIPSLEDQLKEAKADIENAKNATDKKAKEKIVREIEKQIKAEEKKIDALDKEETLTDEELKTLEESVNKFGKMTKKQKEKVIGETFDIRSLDKFFIEESDSDIRHIIQLRIDEVKNAKTDETIGHPKSHLKTSGK